MRSPSWGGQSVFAILDQALFAAANLVVNVLLARWLSAEWYGAFTVTYSVFLLLGVLYMELLAAPMLVFGAGKYAETFSKYLGLLLGGHILLTAMASIVLAAAGVIVGRYGSVVLGQAFGGLATVAPLLLLLWLVRSTFYARLRPQWAAMGSALYLIILTAGLYGLRHVHQLTLLSTLGIMGTASVSVAALLILPLRPEWVNGLKLCIRYGPRTILRLFRLTDRTRQTAVQDSGRRDVWEPATVFYDHSRYAKWSLASAATGWVSANMHYLVLSSTAGLPTVAVMRVLDTMLLPFNHYQAAISRLFVSVFGARWKESHTDLLAYATRITLSWAAQGLIMYVFVRLFAANIVSLLYGRSYSQYGPLLAWYGLILIPDLPGNILGSIFQALVRTDLVFLVHLTFSVGLLIAFLIAARHGVWGIIVARIIMSYAIVPLEVILARSVFVAPKIPQQAAAQG